MASPSSLSLLERVNRAIKAFRFSGTGGGFGEQGWFGGFNRTVPSAQYDYRRESGYLWENSVVYALLSWQTNQFCQAPLCVEQETDERDEEYEPVRGHPLAQIVKRPNPFWSRRDLWGATLLSLNVGQSAYWIKVRSGAGKVVELWWAPHWMVIPQWPSDGSAYISRYRYRVDGKDYFYKPSDVVHFRNNIINPLNQRVSLGSFGASLPDVCTENEAGVMMAAFFRNRGWPGVILSPKENTQLSKEKAETVKTLFQEEFSRDGAGRAMLSTMPLDVNVPQFSPDQMAVPLTRGLATARICAGFGVDPMVIGLQSDQKTYSNYEEANRAAWEHNVIPTQGLIAETLDIQLLPDFDEDPARQVGFVNKRVAALQEKRDELYKRITLAVGAPWLTPNEGRAEAGLDKLEGDENADKLATTVQYDQAMEQAAAAPDPAGPPRKAIVDRWREALAND